MSTFTKVLLATDLTLQSDNLLGCLTNLNPDGETEVVLAHVFDDDDDADPHGSKYKEVVDHLYEYEKKLKAKGYEEIKIITPVGKPEEVLGKAAEDCDADLLMMASHGKGFFERAFKGSTTFDVAKNATLPLFIDRDDDNDNSDDLLSTVMVATDFSKQSLESLNIIRSMRELVKHVLFVHVIEHSRSHPDYKNKRNNAELMLQELVDEMKIFGIESSYIIAKGVASKQIGDICEQKNVGMIMLARTGADRTDNMSLGSTAENVILNVDRAILLLPSEDMDD